MQQVRAICFDLDNTFWDLDPVIPRAERGLYDWYGKHHPRVTERFTLSDILEIRAMTLREMPEMAHDLTLLRMTALRRIAEEAGYGPEMADAAFEVFQNERNAVTLYSDVVPALENMANTHELFVLTNGNANLDVIGIRHFFGAVFTARELGMAKPNSRVFDAVCEKSGMQPHEIAHVGDDPENDILAAAQAGLHTVWVNRSDREWEYEDHYPDYVAADLLELAALLR
ncbi:MAG: HAD family hydrolase [Gammaproteobacteria bacterium]|jgi:putative hydrolase of the HAD superfamily|nr:HAD family hydrolase [Gammaproteobacteria bacterium]MDP6616451.1 HAD family hydrolase [Gammaproteobacteria bacterium]MDP6695926.1 HAD family hydrolase [Gammaproteobacteria bacterium]